ncbi:MAG: hypothetical protein GOU98_01130 [Candidatus Altiarchaeota archaeon]|nr:hypothetical protein [Candidatus Altiarchaeota archaeon]
MIIELLVSSILYQVLPLLGFLTAGYSLLLASTILEKTIIFITLATLSFTRTKKNGSLIVLSLLGMILFLRANDWIYLYFAWELMSVLAYLLINSSNAFNKKSARKIFILNRISGLLLLTAIGIIYSISGSFEFSIIPPTSALLILIAGMIKSSQFPFLWLKDAVRAPTPVSALIHSVTAVAVGPLLISRFSSHFLFLSGLISVWTTLSIIIATILAISSNNQKEVLAYSTIVNLGFLYAFFNSENFIFAFLIHALTKAAYFLLVELYSRDTNYALNLGFNPRSLEGILSLFLMFSLSGAPLFGLYWLKMQNFSSAIITFFSLLYFFKLFSNTFSGNMTPPRNWKILVPLGLGLSSIGFYPISIPQAESLVIFFGAALLAYKLFDSKSLNNISEKLSKSTEWVFVEVSPPEEYLENWASGVEKRTKKLSQGINYIFTKDIRGDVSYIAVSLAALALGVIIR